MTPRISGALLSVAVASGLLLTATPANAAETASTPLTTPPPESTDPSVSTAPILSELPLVTASASPSTGASTDQQGQLPPETFQPEAEPTELPTASQPSEETTAPLADQSPRQAAELNTESPTVHSSDEAIVPITEQQLLQESAETASPDEVSAAADEPVVKDTATTSSVASPSPASQWTLDESLTKEQEAALDQLEQLLPSNADQWTEEQWESFLASETGIEYTRLMDEFYDSTVSDEERAFWEMIDSMFPEGSDEWDEAQWDAFYATPEGQEIDRLTNEFYEQYYDEEPSIELTEEEIAFYAELERRLPSGSEQWSEAQWEEYLLSDAGRELSEFVLTFEFDHAGSEAELEELISYYALLYADDAQWYDDFINRYLNGLDRGTAAAPSSSPEQPAKYEPTTKPVTPSVIKPVANHVLAVTHPVPGKLQVAKQSQTALADTGFSSSLLVGGGALALILGTMALRAARNKTAKH